MHIKASPDVVLMLTHSADHFTVDRVGEALARRGVRPVRVDTDMFPRRVRLSARFTGSVSEHVIEDGEAQVRTNDVRAVWARRVWPPRLAEDLDPRFRDMCARESQAALLGFLDGLHGVRWVNDLGRDYESENKLRQLRLASDAGLRIPRTLVTNDPERARAFFAEVEGAMVAKLLRPVSTSMGQAPAFVYTSTVCEEDLADAELLRHSPMVFQERLEKMRELRIAYVNGSIFAGALDATASVKGKIDWRLAGPDECKWERAEVPVEVAACLHVLMEKLGLVYGAIDIIRTPKGEHVFLEVNPGGEWGMLQRDLDYPISEAIADALLG